MSKVDTVIENLVLTNRLPLPAVPGRMQEIVEDFSRRKPTPSLRQIEIVKEAAYRVFTTRLQPKIVNHQS